MEHYKACGRERRKRKKQARPRLPRDPQLRHAGSAPLISTEAERSSDCSRRASAPPRSCRVLVRLGAQSTRKCARQGLPLSGRPRWRAARPRYGCGCGRAGARAAETRRARPMKSHGPNSIVTFIIIPTHIGRRRGAQTQSSGSRAGALAAPGLTVIPACQGGLAPWRIFTVANWPKRDACTHQLLRAHGPAGHCVYRRASKHAARGAGACMRDGSGPGPRCRCVC